jgi:phage replication-related protein YjqB (UPF0714/DUF867 family)
MDIYKNFIQLKLDQKKGKDYELYIRETNSPIAVIAPHGGGIEPGTTEIADAIAGDDFSFYCFESLKPLDSHELHITSTNFDEPKCVELIGNAEVIIAIHGCKGAGKVVHVGGRDESLKREIIRKLSCNGLDAKIDRTNHAGIHPKNICNRNRSGKGVQLELSRGMRKAMFSGLKRRQRKQVTPVFHRFTLAIREVLMTL